MALRNVISRFVFVDHCSIVISADAVVWLVFKTNWAEYFWTEHSSDFVFYSSSVRHLLLTIVFICLYHRMSH